MMTCLICFLLHFQGTYDPCMFAATKIRRATELKAPFLQCDMYFHTLSLTELQGTEDTFCTVLVQTSCILIYSVYIL